jgi:DNA-directed RNA polymerase subunit E'/Rpb7
VQIAPEDFSKRSIDAIEDNINAKYSNKVRFLESFDDLESGIN